MKALDVYFLMLLFVLSLKIVHVLGIMFARGCFPVSIPIFSFCRLTSILEVALGKCLGSAGSLRTPPLMPYRCLAPGEAEKVLLYFKFLQSRFQQGNNTAERKVLLDFPSLEAAVHLIFVTLSLNPKLRLSNKLVSQSCAVARTENFGRVTGHSNLADKLFHWPHSLRSWRST